MAGARTSPHRRVAEAFVERLRERFDDSVESVLLYGSVARGEAEGVDPDVDLLVVFRNGQEANGLEERVREIAYDIELKSGVVLSLTVLTTSEYERRTDRPFFKHVHRDAQRLCG